MIAGFIDLGLDHLFPKSYRTNLCQKRVIMLLNESTVAAIGNLSFGIDRWSIYLLPNNFYQFPTLSFFRMDFEKEYQKQGRRYNVNDFLFSLSRTGA